MKFCNSVIFADDTTIYVTGNNIKFLYKKMSEDLSKLEEWFNSNSISLNIEKSNYILFKPKNKKPNCNGNIKLEGQELKKVTYTKFLGVHIDENLDWNMHIKHLLLKLASGIYSLNMTKNLLPFNSKRLLYFANIQSHLSYAMSAWGPMITNSNLRKLKVQQNKAVRALFNINKRTRLQPYYRKANILTTKSLIDLSLLKISYRYVNNILPKCIVNLFEIPTHNYATRNRIGLQAPLHTSQI